MSKVKWKPKKQPKGHHYIPLLKTGFTYCWRCGIVIMNTPLAYRAMKEECRNPEED